MFFFTEFIALLQTAVITAKTHDRTNGPNCQNFSQGVTFNDSEAIGTWHLLHFITEKEKGSGDPHCVEFTPVDEQVNIINTYKCIMLSC